MAHPGIDVAADGSGRACPGRGRSALPAALTCRVEVLEQLVYRALDLLDVVVSPGHVVVAGHEIVRDGEFTDARPGRVLRSGRDTDTPSLR